MRNCLTYNTLLLKYCQGTILQLWRFKYLTLVSTDLFIFSFRLILESTVLNLRKTGGEDSEWFASSSHSTIHTHIDIKHVVFSLPINTSSVFLPHSVFCRVHAGTNQCILLVMAHRLVHINIQQGWKGKEKYRKEPTCFLLSSAQCRQWWGCFHCPQFVVYLFS